MEEKNLSAGDAADEWLDPIQRKIMQLYHEYRSRRDVSDLPARKWPWRTLPADSLVMYLISGMKFCADGPMPRSRNECLRYITRDSLIRLAR